MTTTGSTPLALPVLAAGPAPGGCCDTVVRLPLDTSDAERATADLALMAHPVRLQLLDVLAGSEGAVCVCDLEGPVPVKQPTVSHHLKLLRQGGLVHSERRGQFAYYRVDHVALDTLRNRITEQLSILGQ